MIANCVKFFQNKLDFSQTQLICLDLHALLNFQAKNKLNIYNQVRWKGKGNRFKEPPTPKDKSGRYIIKSKFAIDQEDKDWTLNSLEEKPADDVWQRKYFRTPHYTLEQAVDMHRQLADPQMQDNMQGLTRIKVSLDFSTKKKTKFSGNISGLILLPHTFADQKPAKVVAITKTEADQSLALEAGATYVGGLDMIRKIEKGDIRTEEFDHVVLNTDMLVEVSLIKKMLKDLYPNRKQGNLGTDIASMVKLFTYGRFYESVKYSDAYGMLQFPFGQLDMTHADLLENLQVFLAQIVQSKSSSVGNRLVRHLCITCPPSKETFYIDDPLLASSLVPEERDSPTSKKMGKSAAEEVEEEDDDDGGDDENENFARNNVASSA